MAVAVAMAVLLRGGKVGGGSGGQFSGGSGGQFGGGSGGSASAVALERARVVEVVVGLAVRRAVAWVMGVAVAKGGWRFAAAVAVMTAAVVC